MNRKSKGNKQSYPLFTYFCLLLAVAAMTVGGTFARYITISSSGASTGVVPLSCSFSVDEISSTAFNNSDYWVTIENQQHAQNIPREIVFSTHNYKKDNNGVKSSASEIDLQSTFRFYAPRNFVENMAFQILKKGEGNSRIPLTQQYILPQIINKVTTLSGNEGSMSTSDFVDDKNNALDYGEYKGRNEETIELYNYNFDKTNRKSGKFVATTKTDITTTNPDGTTTTENNVQVATIAITAEEHKNVNYEITQTRGRVVKIDGLEGNDMSAPEYYSTYQAESMTFYSMDITLPTMFMEAKQNSDGTYEFIDNQYIMAFTILSQEKFDTNQTDTKVGEHFNVRGICFYTDNTLKDIARVENIKVVNTFDKDGNKVPQYFIKSGDTETEFTLSGNVVSLDGTAYYLNPLTATNLNDPLWNHEDGKVDYEIADIVRKVYPIDIRVLFTQASQVGGN